MKKGFAQVKKVFKPEELEKLEELEFEEFEEKESLKESEEEKPKEIEDIGTSVGISGIEMLNALKILGFDINENTIITKLNEVLESKKKEAEELEKRLESLKREIELLEKFKSSLGEVV